MTHNIDFDKLILHGMLSIGGVSNITYTYREHYRPSHVNNSICTPCYVDNISNKYSLLSSITYGFMYIHKYVNVSRLFITTQYSSHCNSIEYEQKITTKGFKKLKH